MRLYSARPITRHSSSTSACAPASPSRARCSKVAASAPKRRAIALPATSASTSPTLPHPHSASSLSDTNMWPAWPALPFLPRSTPPVHAQAHADAGAPGHVGAVVEALQRAPAALGFQRGDAVVLDPHLAKALRAAAPPAGPSSSRWASRAPGRRCRRRCWAPPPRPGRRAGRTARTTRPRPRWTVSGAMPISAQASSTSRMTCRASASLSPVLAVGSLRRASSSSPAPLFRLTATLVPPMSMQAFMRALGAQTSLDNGAGHQAQQDRWWSAE